MGAATSMWKDTIDRAGAPVLLVDRRRTVSYANRAAHEFLDYPEHALTGLSLEWLSPPSLHGELSHIDAVFRGEAVRQVEGTALRADGSCHDVTMIFEPCLDQRGEVAAVSVRYQANSAEPPPTVARFERIPLTSGVAELSQLDTAKPENDQHDEGVGERLDSALQLLRWVAGRFTCPREPHQPDEARERARMLLVLRDATELVHECRRDLQRRASTEEVTVTSVFSARD